MATIRQVASQAGVSIGTVSKVLNGRDDKVDPATKERILVAIRALRYKPPAFEQNQKAGLSQNLGMIVPDLPEHPLERHSYLNLVFNGVLGRAALRGWSVTIFAETTWSDVGMAVRRKYDGRCDGLVVVAPQPDRDIVHSLHQRGAPIVLIGTTPWIEDVSSIDIDNVQAGKLVAQHFRQLGHRRIAFLAHYHDHVAAKERWEGFRAEAASDVEKLMVGREEGLRGFVHRFVNMGNRRPTALMGLHDGILRDLFRAFEAEGLAVPEDLSVAGVDDAPDVRESGLDLTTVRNPLGDIGARAADMAIARVYDPNVPREIIRIEPSLIVRSSTRPFSARMKKTKK